MKIEQSIVFVKIFDFQILIDIYILGRLEHDLTIFSKCLSVCVRQTFCGKCNPKTNTLHFMKIYAKLQPQLNCFLWILEEIGLQVALCCYISSREFRILRSLIPLDGIKINNAIRNNIDPNCVYMSESACM